MAGAAALRVDLVAGLRIVEAHGKDREWVDMVIGKFTGFNTKEHAADAMAVGVRPEAIIALPGF